MLAKSSAPKLAKTTRIIIPDVNYLLSSRDNEQNGKINETLMTLSIVKDGQAIIKLVQNKLWVIIKCIHLSLS